MGSRKWRAGKPIKKPNYDPKAVTAELLERVVEIYEDVGDDSSGSSDGSHPSLQSIVDLLPDYHLNPMKIRKLLITAGVQQHRQIYEGTVKSEEHRNQINTLHSQGKPIPEIASLLNLSTTTIHSYLPYSKIIYNLDESGGARSVGADRQELYGERKKIIEKLKEDACVENLWSAVILFAGYPFKTSKGLDFTYSLKPNRRGEPGNEIVFSRKEKSITRSSVEMAYKRVLELGGTVAGPKKLGVFGASYLYPVFVQLGVIGGEK